MSPCWKGGQKSGWLSLKSRKTMGRFNVQASPSHGGAWLQVYPSSGWQVAEQPSPSMPLPSSHTSGADGTIRTEVTRRAAERDHARSESAAEQELGLPLHGHFTIKMLQPAQSAGRAGSASSHFSASGCTMPSPQYSPSVQFGLQRLWPPVFSAVPSSHCSPEAMMPSPHTGVHSLRALLKPVSVIMKLEPSGLRSAWNILIS